jgi:polysaccharide biosynthesis/export protein
MQSASIRTIGLVLAMVAVAIAAGCARQDARVDRVNQAVLDLPPAPDRAEQFAEAVSRYQQATAGQEYRLGIGDILEAQIYELEDLDKSKTLTLQIGSSGDIRFPLIGTVKAAGLTADQFRKTVESRLGAEYMVDPQVSVTIKEYHSRQVTVTGAVQKPGVYFLSRNSTTLLDALAMAGCLTEKAGPSVFVRHSRAEAARPVASAVLSTDEITRLVPPAAPVARLSLASQSESAVTEVEVGLLLDEGRLEQNILISDGDVVHVPEAAQFYVSGLVEKPGAFPLRRVTTLLEAVATAGGMKEMASPETVRLVRHRDGRQEVTAIDLEKVVAGKQDNPTLRPNDMIVIGQTQEKKFWTGVGEAMTRVFSLSLGLGPI